MSRYDKGARYERRAKRELEEDGWLLVRSAGSKGVFDIWALKVRLIQVKSTEEPKAWTGELEDIGAAFPAMPGISLELWVWNKGGPWEKHFVGGRHGGNDEA